MVFPGQIGNATSTAPCASSLTRSRSRSLARAVLPAGHHRPVNIARSPRVFQHAPRLSTHRRLMSGVDTKRR